MEGPTPVSALLHAATMVTAGVFLIIRCSLILEYSAFILFLIMFIGVFTALFSSLIGFFQYDIKKIIAYSTCSQLGYMFFSCGLSNYNVAIFHLFNHAFFKALLFLSAGSLIHALFDEQDIRKMGRLIYNLPFTYLTFLIGSLAIMGFPYLSGFYSKDVLLEFVFVRYLIDSNFIYCFGILAAFFTASYSLKLILYSFFLNKSNSFYIFFRKYEFFVCEDFIYLFIPLFILSFFSILTGYIFSEVFLGIGSFFFQDAILVLPFNYSYINNQFISPLFINLPFLFSLLGLVIFSVLFNFFSHFDKYIYIFINFCSSLFYHGFFFNSIYNYIFNIFYKFSYYCNVKLIDKGVFE